MIIEKNCIFFYPEDLIKEYRIGINEVNMSMFITPIRNELIKNIENSKLVVYIDPNKKQFKYLSGPKIGLISSY